MSKIQDEALKWGISKDILVELLCMHTKWPFQDFDECMKQIKPYLRNYAKLSSMINDGI